MATFTNQATLTYRNSVVNSNVVAGEILETLAVNKNALAPTYDAAGNVVYVVNISNSGATALSNLTLTDDLGAYEFGGGTLTPLTYVDGTLNYFVDGVLQPAPAVAEQSPLTVTGISLPAGATGTLVYQTEVNGFAPLVPGSTITNTATFSGGGLADTASDTATVSVNQAPRLDITKAVTPATVGPNDRITYTFNVLNYGNTATVATDDVVITDTFDPVLSDIVVSYNGVTWTAGTEYTYNSTTGEFSTVAGAVTVPAATYTQDAVTGEWVITPGQITLTVTGAIS